MQLVEVPKLTMSEEDTSVLKTFRDLDLDITNIKTFLSSFDSINFASFEKVLLDNGILARLAPVSIGVIESRLTRTVGRSTFI